MDMRDKIIGDKAITILREMMATPGREWVIRDFVDGFKFGRGWVAAVMVSLREGGYLQGKTRGRSAVPRLRNPERLLQEWTHHYLLKIPPGSKKIKSQSLVALWIATRS